MKQAFEKFTSKLMASYIDVVYRTSHVTEDGLDLIRNGNEKYIVVFWHGDSYSLYPALKGSKITIITTKDRRGDYINNMCTNFGYHTFRMPDVTEGKMHLLKLIRSINTSGEHLCIALDGPLGPYHEPKDFSFFLAMASRRKIIPVTIQVKKKLSIKRRWDHFKIPLPFNEIVLKVGRSIDVTSDDKKFGFEEVKRKILKEMLVA